MVQTPVYGKEKRHITPLECLRLQSFPDDFKLLDDDKASYKQLGNSINVHNARNVIESTLQMYGIIGKDKDENKKVLENNKIQVVNKGAEAKDDLDYKKLYFDTLNKLANLEKELMSLKKNN